MDIIKPTIVHVSPYYLPHLGGLERVAQMSAEKLAKRGYPVHVITSASSGIKRGSKQKNNLRVTALWSFDFAHTPFAPMFLWQLLALPKNSIIHLHLSQAYYPELVLLVSKLRHIPYVVHFHLDVGPSGILGPLFSIYKKLLWKPLMKNARKVVACSEDQVAVIQNKFGVPEENIVFVPNAVSADFFSNCVYLSPTKEFRLLYVGRLAHQKRVERLIEAVSKLSIPVRLTIVGDGDEWHKLEKLVQKLRLTNIIFVGGKNEAEVRLYHRESDALVISSDEEGTSLVILEAMAAGLPIIGTNVRGIRDLLRDTGVLVDKPYPENFAKAIKELWRNPEKLVLLSKQSSKKSKEYKPSRFIDQLEQVYSSIQL
jgi:glycosyltransferase involved in cell wall biosynthesis